MSRPPRPAIAIGLLAVLGVVPLAACSSPTTDAAGRRTVAITAPTPPSTTTPAPSSSANTTTVAPTTTAPPTTPAPPAPPAPATAPSAPAPVPPPPVAAPVAPTFTVTNVVDGDTIDVVDGTGATSRVRLVGIDAPETGACGGEAATMAMVALVLGQPVTLTPGGDGEDVDRYGRLLRYADQAGRDAGLELITSGHAIARYDSRDGYGRHDREDSYIAADAASPDVGCPAPQPAAALPVTPPASGPVHYANCDAVRAAGAAPIHPGDPGWQQKFDRDDDGVGCE